MLSFRHAGCRHAVSELRTDEDFESLPAVHFLIAPRGLVEGDLAVEDTAGVDEPGEDVGHQGLDVSASRRGSSGEGDVAAEEAAEADEGRIFLDRHRDQGAVGERDPDGLGLAAADAVGVPEPAVPAGGLQAFAAVVAGAVGPGERRDDQVARLCGPAG
jgi:hypothetical protein